MTWKDEERLERWKEHCTDGLALVNIIEEQRALLDQYRTQLRKINNILNQTITVDTRLQLIRDVIEGRDGS